MPDYYKATLYDRVKDRTLALYVKATPTNVGSDKDIDVSYREFHVLCIYDASTGGYTVGGLACPTKEDAIGTAAGMLADKLTGSEYQSVSILE